MDDGSNSLHDAQYIICIVTGALCIIPFSIVLIRVNKRIPASFFIIVLLYTAAIFSRAIGELVSQNDFTNKVRIITTSTCVCLIEISLSYFIFQIQAFRN